MDHLDVSHRQEQWIIELLLCRIGRASQNRSKIVPIQSVAFQKPMKLQKRGASCLDYSRQLPSPS